MIRRHARTATVLIVVFLVFCPAARAQSTPPSRADFLGIVRGEGCQNRIDAMLRADAYLSRLSDGELFEFLDELAGTEPGCLYRSPVMHHLLRRWENVPAEALGLAVADRTRRASCRRFLLDFLVSSLKREARRGVADKAGSLGDTGDILMIVATEEGGSGLRGEALEGLASLATCMRRFEEQDTQRLRNWGEQAAALMASPEENEVVRGRAVQLLAVLDDQRGARVLRSIVLEPDAGHPFLSCCAVSSLARLGDRDEIPVVAEVVRRAGSREVYETAVRSLLLFHDPAVLVPVMETCDRFGGEVAREFLTRNEAVVQAALSSSNRDHLRASALAVGFAGLVHLKDRLYSLVEHHDPLVRLAAVDSLLRVGNAEDRAKLKELAGRESDPAVLELLKHLE